MIETIYHPPSKFCVCPSMGYWELDGKPVSPRADLDRSREIGDQFVQGARTADVAGLASDQPRGCQTITHLIGQPPDPL